MFYDQNYVWICRAGSKSHRPNRLLRQFLYPIFGLNVLHSVTNGTRYSFSVLFSRRYIFLPRWANILMIVVLSFLIPATCSSSVGVNHIPLFSILPRHNNIVILIAGEE